jgi:hypothetical protein
MQPDSDVQQQLNKLVQVVNETISKVDEDMSIIFFRFCLIF